MIKTLILIMKNPVQIAHNIPSLVMTATFFIYIQPSCVVSEGHNKNVLGTLFCLRLISKQKRLHQRSYTVTHHSQPSGAAHSLSQTLIRLDIKLQNKSLHTLTQNTIVTQNHTHTVHNLNLNIPYSSMRSY